jgi:uncharacterized protein (DUF362 family)/ferredoxin
MQPTVSLKYMDSYDYERLREAVQALLEPLGGIGAFVSKGETVLLKPNMLSAKDPDAAVTTHPALVRVVAELVSEVGATVVIGDSPGIGGFSRVAERTGIALAAKQSNSRLAAFDEIIEVQGTGMFKKISLAKVYWEADKVINLPKLKTHEMMTMTCAVKNLFGAVVGAEKAGWHLKAGHSRERFARLLLDIYLLKKPVLNIVDGIIAMEGDGPGSGDPVRLNALIAGNNAVAVDVIAAGLAGIPAEMLYLEQEARAIGLDGVDRDSIIIRGDSLAKFSGRPFRLPKGSDLQFGLPGFLKNGLRRHLTTLPLVDEKRCVLCGVCRDACPPEAIRIKNSALSIDYGRCIRCWCCRELCPHDAMGIKRGMLLKAVEGIRQIRKG